MHETALAPTLTPRGHLVLARMAGAPVLPGDLSRRLEDCFARGSGHGLLQLGTAEVETALPPVLAYWREFSARYVTAVCMQPNIEPREYTPTPPPPFEALEATAASAPPMTGAEHLTSSVLQTLWNSIDAAFQVELAESKLPVQDFLKRKNQAWNLVGRVHFNLAENRQDDESPFAFLATYTTRLSAHGKAQHLPLGRALSEYAGAANKSRLLSLLLPVQRAAEQCPWLKTMGDRTPFRRGTETLIRKLREDNQRRRRISEDEETRLLEVAQAFLRSMIITALDTGMRQGEMLALRFGDIDWKRQLIILRGETTKSRKTRTVPIATARLQAVLKWLQLDADDNEKPAEALVFSDEAGEPVGRFRTAWVTAVLKAHGEAGMEVVQLDGAHSGMC